MYDVDMADQARRLRRRKRRLALFSVGLLALVTVAGLLLSAYARVREASDRVT
jgi:hypothetical protein